MIAIDCERLQHIRIVLLDTSHPGNIGATARAMKNMCFQHLYLVNPKQFPCAEATARASGADDLLSRAIVCDSMEEALEGCTRVYGMSARSRSLGWPTLNSHECAQKITAEPDVGEVALVFGNEQSGMKNEQLDRCHYLVHIPTNPAYSSFNLAAAVQVMCYDVMMTVQGAQVTAENPPEVPLADASQMEQFYQHMERALIALEMHDPDNPRQLMRRVRRLFNRAELDQRETNLLRGILSAAEKFVHRAKE